jgi:RimJ/RimL family protein N-acetyltransferase
MLHLVVDRPIFARAATDNIGSIRVLQKYGFKIIGKNKDFANGRGEDTEEYILRLDLIKQSLPADRDNARELTLVRMARLRSGFFLNSGRQHACPRVSHL